MASVHVARMDLSFLLNPTTTADVPTPRCVSPVPSTLPPLALYASLDMTPPQANKKMASRKRKLPTQLPRISDSSCESCSEEDDAASTHVDEDDAATKKRKIRKSRTPPCQVEGCPNFAVSRGCCVRHGGGSRCIVEGCANRAKLHKRCFQHGGYKTCLTEGCTRKAKRYGYCWSHGGGRICEVANCTKVSTQGGLCWAHGGGNRCKLDGCSRRSYQKYGYYCIDHAAHSNSSSSAEAECH